LATSISKANFQTALGNCYDAIDSESWASAWKYYAMAEAQHAGLLKSSSGDGMAMERRASLEGLKDAIKAAESGVDQRAGAGNRLITARTGYSARGR